MKNFLILSVLIGSYAFATDDRSSHVSNYEPTPSPTPTSSPTPTPSPIPEGVAPASVDEIFKNAKAFAEDPFGLNFNDYYEDSETAAESVQNFAEEMSKTSEDSLDIYKEAYLLAYLPSGLDIPKEDAMTFAKKMSSKTRDEWKLYSEAAAFATSQADLKTDGPEGAQKFAEDILKLGTDKGCLFLDVYKKELILADDPQLNLNPNEAKARARTAAEKAVH